jgi:hypothetical protein
MTASRAGATAVLTCFAAVVCLVLSTLGGCGGNGNPGGPDDDDPPAVGDTIYVDPAFAGDEYGTRDNPFDTIGEALAIAAHGDRIVLAAGSYDDQVDVEVRHAVEIVGAGEALTVFGAGFVLAADTDEAPVVIESLACGFVHTLADTTVHSRGAYEIRGCALGALVDTVGCIDSLHYRLIDDCAVAGDLLLGGSTMRAGCFVKDSEIGGRLFLGGAAVRSACVASGCDVAGDVEIKGISAKDTLSLESCTVGGDAEVWSVSMNAEQRIVDCDIAGSARLWGISTHSARASGNTIGGDSLVVYGVSMGACTVTENYLTAGSIKVRARSISGVIAGNRLDDGGLYLWGISSHVPVEDNTVTRSTVGTGISVVSVSLGGLVRGNTVTVPYTLPTGVPVPADSLAPAGISVVGISVRGARSNVVSGGSYGVYMNAVAGHGCSGNTVTGAHTGIAVCAVSAQADSNDVRDCAGDGIGLYPYPDTSWGDCWLTVQASTAVENGGAGIRAAGRCDLGGTPDPTAAQRAAYTAGGTEWGGRLRSDGMNVLTGNGDYDLVIDMLATEVDTIWALGNAWDHADSLGIGEHDIYDGADDPSLSRVVFWPASRSRSR